MSLLDAQWIAKDWDLYILQLFGIRKRHITIYYITEMLIIVCSIVVQVQQFKGLYIQHWAKIQGNAFYRYVSP